MDRSVDSSPPLDRVRNLQTPWDGWDLDLVSTSCTAQQSPLRRLKFEDLIPTYISTLPLGPSAHANYWRDCWNSSQNAAAYHELIEAFLSHEIDLAQELSKLSNMVIGSSTHTATTHSANHQTILAPPAPKRRRKSEEASLTETSGLHQRLRISKSHSPISARTRSASKRSPAPSPVVKEPPPTSRSKDVQDALQIHRIHSEIIARLKRLLHLLRQAIEIEESQQVASSCPDKVHQQLRKIEAQAKVLCQGLEQVSREINGFTAIHNVNNQISSGDNGLRWSTELDQFFEQFEKGVIKHWLDRICRTRDREIDEREQGSDTDESMLFKI